MQRFFSKIALLNQLIHKKIYSPVITSEDDDVKHSYKCSCNVSYKCEFLFRWYRQSIA